MLVILELRLDTVLPLTTLYFGHVRVNCYSAAIAAKQPHTYYAKSNDFAA